MLNSGKEKSDMGDTVEQSEEKPVQGLNEYNVKGVRKELIIIKYDIAQFFQKSSAAGVFLCITAFIAMIVANSPLSTTYDHLIHTERNWLDLVRPHH